MRLWRHLDLSLTAAAAVVIGTMGMLNLAGAGVTTGATLATLGVLTAAMLAARLQTHRLQTSTDTLTELARERIDETPSADRLLSPAGPGTDVDLRTAGEVGIIGVTLGRTLRHHLTDLRACLHRGGVVRIAVIDRTDDTVAEAARRSTVAESPEIFAHRLMSTADLLSKLGASTGTGRLEVRFLDFVPAAGLLMVDPSEPHGLVRVEIYSHRFAADEAVLPLHAGRDQQWYGHFRREFEQVWSAGRPATAAVAAG